MKNTISFVGCFTIVWNMLDDIVNVVLVKRNDKPVWELPGGGLDSEDIKEGESPFENCAIRELFQETGLVLDKYNLIDGAVLVQRVPIGNHSIGTGTVFIYSNRHSGLDGSFENNSFVTKLQSFRGDETADVSITPIDEVFFAREDVSLATKRMISVLLKRISSHEKRHVVYGALSQEVYIPQFDLTL